MSMDESLCDFCDCCVVRVSGWVAKEDGNVDVLFETVCTTTNAVRTDAATVVGGAAMERNAVAAEAWAQVKDAIMAWNASMAPPPPTAVGCKFDPMTNTVL